MIKKLLVLLPLLIIVAILACSDENNNNPITPDDTPTSTWNNDGQYWQSVLDATSGADYAYFSFATQDTVTLTGDEAANSSNWDIAFKRDYVILNGGVSGAKGVEGVDLAEAGSPDSTDFAVVIDTSDITGSDWQADRYNLVVDDWYDYDPVSHTLDVNRNVYVLKDAAGNYVKFQVIGMAGGGMPPDMGSVTFRFVYAADGSSDVSGAPDTVSIDVGSGTGYVDFSTGSEVTPADPMESLDWDIAFSSYEIHLNATVFGPGAARAYPMYGDLDDPADFDGVTQAPTQSQGYFADQFGSVLTNWYDYNPDTHQLSSYGHVYLIKSDDAVYKLQISSYYRNVGGSPVSAWYSFKWARLD